MITVLQCSAPWTFHTGVFSAQLEAKDHSTPCSLHPYRENELYPSWNQGTHDGRVGIKAVKSRSFAWIGPGSHVQWIRVHYRLVGGGWNVPCLSLLSLPWSSYLKMLWAAVGSQHLLLFEHSILLGRIRVLPPLKWMLIFPDIRKTKGKDLPLLPLCKCRCFISAARRFCHKWRKVLVSLVAPVKALAAHHYAAWFVTSTVSANSRGLFIRLSLLPPDTTVKVIFPLRYSILETGILVDLPSWKLVEVLTLSSVEAGVEHLSLHCFVGVLFSIPDYCVHLFPVMLLPALQFPWLCCCRIGCSASLMPTISSILIAFSFLLHVTHVPKLI